jgi:hypothetical protein
MSLSLLIGSVIPRQEMLPDDRISSAAMNQQVACHEFCDGRHAIAPENRITWSTSAGLPMTMGVRW